MKKTIMLKVAEAISDDVNKGIARMDLIFMKRIGVKSGDVINIRGERMAAVIAEGAYLGDLCLDLIRLDGVTRRNAGVGIGEFIEITKAEAKDAKKIIIKHVRDDVEVKASPEAIKHWFIGKAVMKGNLVSAANTGARFSVDNIPFYKDIFNDMDEAILGFSFGELKFEVLETVPKGIVKITDKTVIILKEGKGGKKQREKKPLKYSRSKKTLTIRKKILAKAIGVKPEDIKRVVVK